MYTPTDVRQQLRQELSDTQRPYTWSDTRLDSIILSAARQIGSDAPHCRQFIALVNDDQRTFPFAANAFAGPANNLIVDFGTLRQGQSAGVLAGNLTFALIPEPTAIRVLAVALQAPGATTWTPIYPGPVYATIDLHQAWQYDPATAPVICLRQQVLTGTLASVEYLAGSDYNAATDLLTDTFDQEYFEGVTALACALAEKRLTSAPAGTGQTSGIRNDHRFDALYQAWLVRHKKRHGIQSAYLTTAY